MTLRLNNLQGNHAAIDYVDQAQNGRNSTITFPQADGTVALTANIPGTGAGGGLVGNISRATIFRTSAGNSNNNDVVGNWEIPSDTVGEAGNITAAADGVTQANGVFTFPVTGFYMVQFNGQATLGAGGAIFLSTQVTSNNGGAWTTIAVASAGNGSNGAVNTSLSSNCLIDCTDVGQVRVRFQISGMSVAGSELLGNTVQNFTAATFLRLGDT